VAAVVPPIAEGADLGVEVLDRAEAAAVRLQMMVPTGRFDACPRWAIGGGKTHLASGRIAATGSLAGLRLCMVLHVGNSGGGAGWAAGQIGEPAHPGQRVSAKDP